MAPSLNCSNLANSRQQDREISNVFNRRVIPLALLVACFLIIAAIDQNVRHKGNVAHITIQAGDALTLTFLRQHMRGREACEATAESFAELMVTNLSDLSNYAPGRHVR